MTGITTAAAAAQAGVTVATIRTWCRIGAVAAVKRAGRWIVDTASLAYRITIGTMKKNRKDAMTEPEPMPWDDDHDEAAKLNRLVANGVSVETILEALGSDARGMGRYRPFNGQSRRWLETQLTKIDLRIQDENDRAAAQRTAHLATPRQVDYILTLLDRRARSGDGGGFFSGPTDRAGIEKLSRSEASSYIDSLKGDY